MALYISDTLTPSFSDKKMVFTDAIFDDSRGLFQLAINDQFKVVTSFNDLKDDSVKGSLAVVAGEKNILYIKTNTMWEEFSSGIKIVTSESELDDDAPDGSLTVVINPKPKLYIKGSDAWEEYYKTIPNASTTEKGLVQIASDSGITALNGIISVIFDTTEYTSENINNPEFEFFNNVVASPDVVNKIVDAKLNAAIYDVLNTPL